MNEIETHPFEPFIPENASVLIVGSFPGKEHTRNNGGEGQWFYGAKRNQFWKIVSSVYNAELLTTEDKKKLFTDKGIAVTDIFLKVRRKQGGNLDNDLEIIEYNDKALESILESRKFESIFFTSKFVEKQFLKFFPDTTNGECLPSPSPRYARVSKADKINYYKSKLPR